MKNDFDTKPINEMRRKDRSKDDEWIKKYLKKAPFAFISSTVDDQPFINSNTFVYEENSNCIYFHTSQHGRLKHNIEKNNKACLSIAEMGRLLPARIAKEFSVEYKSVVVFGYIEEVEDLEHGKKALQLLNEKYFPHLKPGDDYRPVTDHEVEHVSTFKFVIESWSGKQKVEPDDFKGAFNYKT
jgi:nitroimidazol reductase NimA-like FMN-containing flavoprotein (pyridoxamine 5'-phosphate oxidase superfamily)